jgi:hypothetical protein
MKSDVYAGGGDDSLALERRWSPAPPHHAL